MFLRILQKLTIVIFVVGLVRADDPLDNGRRQVIKGFWQGFWGGGEANGVIRLPALGELLIDGNRLTALHFPNIGNVSGTVRIDEAAKKLRITPDAEPGKPPTPRNIVWSYEITDGKLTLTLDDNSTISLELCQVERTALANTQVELCTVKSIDEAGNLLVAKFTLLQGAESDASYFNRRETKLKTGLATILLVQRSGVKKISVSEARALVGDGTPAALVYRHDDGPSPPRFFRGEMFKDLGDVPADHDAIRETLAKTLRPGTLVFIVSSRENAPMP